MNHDDTCSTDATNRADDTGIDISGTTPDATDTSGQLRLFEASSVPLQFRLDRATRERGLAHVAEMRRMILGQMSRQAA